jgi:hypothetical protein
VRFHFCLFYKSAIGAQSQILRPSKSTMLMPESASSSLMSMLEPEEMDEFEDDELLLLSSSISSNACLSSSIQATHWWRSKNKLHHRDDIW